MVIRTILLGYVCVTMKAEDDHKVVVILPHFPWISTCRADRDRMSTLEIYRAPTADRRHQ